jgi:hypothetical protein
MTQKVAEKPEARQRFRVEARMLLVIAMRLLFVLFFVALAPLAEAQSSYRVQFRAFTAFGDPIAVHVLTLADPVHHQELSSHCVKTVCNGIPEGPYTFSVALEDTGRKVDGSAVIYRTNQIIPVDVGTATQDIDNLDFPTISGTIASVGDVSKMWIRLEQLYSDSSVSAAVQPDGSFRLEQVRPGNWMLLVFNEGKLVHFEPFVCKMTGNLPLKLHVKSGEPLVQARRRNGKNQAGQFTGE